MEIDSIDDDDFLSNNRLNNTLMEHLSKNIAMEIGNKYVNYICKRRAEKHRTDVYRTGPAPIEESEAIRKSIAKATYGTLDSDLEDLDFEEIRSRNTKHNSYTKFRVTTNDRGDNLASCRALVVYFSKLAKTKDDEELIDLNFVDSLLDSGADINFSDKHGQTILHEISRGWHPHIARFALEHGADINKADCYGRTPLHLAAAVDYDDMVEFLVDNGADLSVTTVGELQTPMHYAAKNNATASLKVMLRLGARINERDYKRRTPLFVAAETARAEAARYLIEQGAPAGVYDSSGTPCLSLMIEKMPQIAIEAVEQFHLLDRAFRKHYYYLSYLEPDPNYLIEYIPENKRELKEVKERKKLEKKMMKAKGEKLIKKDKTYAKTPLEVIVQYNQLDIIMHPVFQRLLYVKWKLFGKFGSAKLLALNLFYTLLWTTLGIMMPRDRQYYTPLADNWWRLILELIGVLMTMYFIYTEIHELRAAEHSHNHWRQWRTRHMERDLHYCHPRWPEEKQFLTSELEQIRTYQRTYFREPWNIFEWVAYVVVLTLVLTRIMSSASGNETAEEIHPRVYALGLIVIWLRFMRTCRVFRTLGPFIAILGSVIADTMKFAFLFFEFFVPYTVAFWILFGGHKNGDIMTQDSAVNWENFNDLTFSVWTMTVLGPFDWNGLVMVDRLMAQILCGTYFCLVCVVCMNLYIALLSDTFARVYSQAKANAVMQQAKSVITLESKLNKFNRSKFGHYMQKECSPQEVYTRDEKDGDDGGLDMFDRISRQIINRVIELEEKILYHFKLSECIPPTRCTSRNTITGEGGDGNGGGGGGGGSGGASRSGYFGNSKSNALFDNFVQKQNMQNAVMKNELGNLKQLMGEIKTLLVLQSSSIPPLHSSTLQQNYSSAYRKPSIQRKVSIAYPNNRDSIHNSLASSVSTSGSDVNRLQNKETLNGTQRTNDRNAVQDQVQQNPFEDEGKEDHQQQQQQKEQDNYSQLLQLHLHQQRLKDEQLKQEQRQKQELQLEKEKYLALQNLQQQQQVKQQQLKLQQNWQMLQQQQQQEQEDYPKIVPQQQLQKTPSQQQQQLPLQQQPQQRTRMLLQREDSLNTLPTNNVLNRGPNNINLPHANSESMINLYPSLPLPSFTDDRYSEGDFESNTLDRANSRSKRRRRKKKSLAKEIYLNSNGNNMTMNPLSLPQNNSSELELTLPFLQAQINNLNMSEANV